MLEVTVNINREVIVAQLYAVRTKPKGKVKNGTVCTYNIVYNNTIVGMMTGKYGCGVDLAIELLKKFKEEEHVYKAIVMHKLMEKMEKNND